MNADLLDHLTVKRYGDFTLTDAVRPAVGVPVRPREGFRIDVFRDSFGRPRLPMLSAAVSAEKLFDAFLALVAPLGEVVHVVLESSHGSAADRHRDYRRQHIDTAVLLSHFCDAEDLLLNDGCTGVAVLAKSGRAEVQFDEHKLLHVYARDLRPFKRALREMGIRRRRVMPLLSDAEHLHHSSDECAERFGQLAIRLGVADFDRVLSDESF